MNRVALATANTCRPVTVQRGGVFEVTTPASNDFAHGLRIAYAGERRETRTWALPRRETAKKHPGRYHANGAINLSRMVHPTEAYIGGFR